MNDRSDRTSTTVGAPASVGTRARILDAALRLFAERGFHGASMRDLAKVVELQASALYVHFPSKEHVLAELARDGHELHHQALRAALLEAGSDPVDQLRAIVAAHARVHALHPHLAMVINGEMKALSPELAGPALALRKQSAMLLADILERGVALGRFRAARVEIVAAAIGAIGMRIPHWFSRASGISIDELAATQAELAVRMAGAEG